MEKNIYAPTIKVQISEATQNLINAKQSFHMAHIEAYKALSQYYDAKHDVIAKFFAISNELDNLFDREIGEHINEDLHY